MLLYLILKYFHDVNFLIVQIHGVLRNIDVVRWQIIS